MGINDSLTSIKDILVGLDNAKAMGDLMELQTQAFSIIEENKKLKIEIEKLKNNDDLSNRLTFKDGVYYLDDGEDPYCPTCWDSKQKLIHIVPPSKQFRMLGKWQCQNCERFFGN